MLGLPKLLCAETTPSIAGARALGLGTASLPKSSMLLHVCSSLAAAKSVQGTLDVCLKVV